MELNLRPPMLQDLPAIQMLFVETIRTTCRKDYTPQQLEAWAASVQDKDRWAAFLNTQYFILAELENKLVGFGALAQGNYLNLLYVHPNYLRRGIASHIYAALAQEARRQGFSQLMADVSKTARPFFESKGFRVVRENSTSVRGVELINYHMEQ